MKLYIKFMLSTRCKIVVKDILKDMDLHFVIVDLGEVEIMEDLDGEQLEELKSALLVSGLELMDNKKGYLFKDTLTNKNYLFT